MEQVGMEASSRRSMENRCLFNLFESIGKKYLQPDKKNYKNKLSKREQTKPEHHKKPRTLFVASPK